MTYAREFLKTACRHLSVSDEAFLHHFDQLVASTTGLRPLTISTADPAQAFTRRGMLKFVHDCLYVLYTPDRLSLLTIHALLHRLVKLIRTQELPLTRERFRTCRYNSCSAGNRCSFCALNPKRRCAQGCGVASKQTELKALEAPCEAPLKVAIHAIEADNAQSSSAGLDLADTFLEVCLVQHFVT